MQGIQFDDQQSQYYRSGSSMGSNDSNNGFVVKFLMRRMGVADVYNAKLILLAITAAFFALAIYVYDGIINEPQRQKQAQQAQDAQMFEGTVLQ